MWCHLSWWYQWASGWRGEISLVTKVQWAATTAGTTYCRCYLDVPGCKPAMMTLKGGAIVRHKINLILFALHNSLWAAKGGYQRNVSSLDVSRKLGSCGKGSKVSCACIWAWWVNWHSITQQCAVVLWLGFFRFLLLYDHMPISRLCQALVLWLCHSVDIWIP